MSQNSNIDPKPLELRPNLAQPEPSSPSSKYEASPRPSRAYTPPPGAQPESSTASQPSSQQTWQMAGIGIIAVASLALATWYGASTRQESSPATPVVATAANAQKVLVVSLANADLKATDALKSILASGASAAAGNELRAANAAGLQALGKASPNLAEEVKSGKRILYRIHLLDSFAQDGDHVELFVDGITFGDINLKNAGDSILIPMAPGTPVQIKILATADGGGGVTIGFVSSFGEARTDVLQVGQFEQWQVMLK